jgi:hypothetical protein
MVKEYSRLLVTRCEGPEIWRTSRVEEFLDNRLTDGDEIKAFSTPYYRVTLNGRILLNKELIRGEGGSVP